MIWEAMNKDYDKVMPLEIHKFYHVCSQGFGAMLGAFLVSVCSMVSFYLLSIFLAFESLD